MSNEIANVFPCADWFFVYGPATRPDVKRIAAWGQHRDGRLLGLIPGEAGERPALEIPPIFVKGKYKHWDDLSQVERDQVQREANR